MLLLLNLEELTSKVTMTTVAELSMGMLDIVSINTDIISTFIWLVKSQIDFHAGSKSYIIHIPQIQYF